MRYRPEDYMMLRVVSDPDSPSGYHVLDVATGRPVGCVAVVDVKKHSGPVPQEVKLTLVGIPVDLNLPEWGAYVHAQKAAAEHAQRLQREQEEKSLQEKKARDIRAMEDSM